MIGREPRPDPDPACRSLLILMIIWPVLLAVGFGAFLKMVML